MKLADAEVFRILGSNEAKFANVLKTIRNIDKDNNGYVTLTELDDILKLEYAELLNKDIH